MRHKGYAISLSLCLKTEVASGTASRRPRNTPSTLLEVTLQTNSIPTETQRPNTQADFRGFSTSSQVFLPRMQWESDLVAQVFLMELQLACVEFF